MYAAEFEYYCARSLADAHRLLAEHPGSKLLAGGHTLIPLMKLRLASPAAVIDIGRIAELKGITVGDGLVRIGALTTHADLAASVELQRASPLLAEAAGLVGDQQVRNRGTIGGNIAHADPASDLPTVLVALGARVVATGPRGERTIDAKDFFQGVMTTALATNEVITAVLVPAAGAGSGSAYVKFTHPASRYAVIGCAAVVTMRDRVCSAASIAVGGLVPRPVKAASVEAALAGTRPSTDVVSGAAAKVGGDLGDDIVGDIFASAEYRRAVAPVYVKRAVTLAVERAG